MAYSVTINFEDEKQANVLAMLAEDGILDEVINEKIQDLGEPKEGDPIIPLVSLEDVKFSYNGRGNREIEIDFSSIEPENDEDNDDEI